MSGMHFLTLSLLLLGLAAIRGTLRLAAVMDLLPEWRDTLLAYAWAWTLLAPIVPFVYAVQFRDGGIQPANSLAWNSLRAGIDRARRAYRWAEQPSCCLLRFQQALRNSALGNTIPYRQSLPVLA